MVVYPYEERRGETQSYIITTRVKQTGETIGFSLRSVFKSIKIKEGKENALKTQTRKEAQFLWIIGHSLPLQ